MMDSRSATTGARRDATCETRPAPVVQIDYWTDPLCCWSWALEPQWRRLRYTFGDGIRCRYRMGGMIPDWSSYDDPLNCVSRPLQMGPVWFQVRHLSGMPIDDAIWALDPPSSSYLPCVAVKAAGLQGAEIAERYLRRIREAVMCHRRNISRREVLISVAQELAADLPAAFDAEAFQRDLESPEAIEAMRSDLQQASYLKIGRFPTLTIHRPGAAQGIMVVGYQPYASLVSAVRKVAPELAPARPAPTADEYGKHWPDLLPRELEEIASEP